MPALTRHEHDGPMPDIAPFAPVSDEMWREAQRRRSLIRRLEDLASDARDERLELAASLLREAALNLRGALFCTPSRPAPRPAGPPRQKRQRNAPRPAANQD